MQTIDVESWEQLEATVQGLTYPKRKVPGSNQPRFLFRGQNDADWHLTTTLERWTTRHLSFAEYFHTISRLKPLVETFTGTTWAIPEPPEYIKWLKDFDTTMPIGYPGSSFALRSARVCDPRGLETHSGPHTGLLKMSDVARARPLSPGSGEGQRLPVNACARRGRERASHQSCSLPDLWLMTVGPWRSAAHAWSRSVTSSVPTWLELDVWLARSLPRYAARNFSIEKTVPRESM